MGFRDPVTTSEGVDTGSSPTGPGVRLYQDDSGAWPKGVLEYRNGIGGDVAAQLVLDSFVDLSQGFARSFGNAFTMRGADTNGVDAAELVLSVVEAAAGGYEAVAELLNARRFTLPRIRLTSTTDAGPSSTDHAFQIGPDNGNNVVIDNNEIMMRNNGVPGGLVLTSPRTSTESEDPAAAPSNALVPKSYISGLTAGGLASVAAVANTVVTLAVSFGQTFDSPPNVTATPASTTPQQVQVGVGSITTTGFTLYVFRTTTATTGVQWTATLTD